MDKEDGYETPDDDREIPINSNEANIIKTTSIVDYYKTQKEPNIIHYYNSLKEPLIIDINHINTLYEDRLYCEQILNDPYKSEQEIRVAKYSIIGMTSTASNDIFENQISKILKNKNIDTKHGWDAYNENMNEPFEYKPTKIDTGKKKYNSCMVSINDDSYNKINNISPYKDRYNNYYANLVIAPINKNTSEFICIYMFKEYILYNSRLLFLKKEKDKKKPRIVYTTNINKCIKFSEIYNEKYYYWHNPKFI